MILWTIFAARSTPFNGVQTSQICHAPSPAMYPIVLPAMLFLSSPVCSSWLLRRLGWGMFGMVEVRGGREVGDVARLTAPGFTRCTPLPRHSIDVRIKFETAPLWLVLVNVEKYSGTSFHSICRRCQMIISTVVVSGGASKPLGSRSASKKRSGGW